MVRYGILSLAILALGACGPGHADDDTSDDDAGADAGEGMGGLRFVFTAPDLGTTVDGVTIDSLDVRMRDIRALGDAAPGDERTTLDAYSLEFHGETGGNEIHFDLAPPGRYSALELVVDAPQDGESAWEMEGTVELAEVEDFFVEDDASRSISLPLVGVEVAPGETVRVVVEIDVVSVVDGVDWASVPTEDGHLQIDDDFAGMAAVRSQFATAFSIADVSVE